MLTIPEAIRSFGKGFSFKRSFTGPYEFVPIGQHWIMRDRPGSSRAPRLAEVIAHASDPREVIDTIRTHEVGRHAICAVDATDAPHREIVDRYKALGYRLLRTEPMFVRDLDGIDRAGDWGSVRLVTTISDADRVAKAAGSRQILPKHLLEEPPPVRLYAAWIDERPVGWVSSIDTGNGTTWVQNLYVQESMRRKGIGAQLMKAMLADDVRRGIAYSVLLASHTGAKLYPKLGYEQIALLQLFMPIKRIWG